MKKYFALCALAMLTACHHHVPPCSYYRENAETPIYFHFNSTKVTDASKQTMDTGLTFFQRHRFRKIQLDGYADEVGGTSNGNMELSRRRVMAVRDYMIANGIAEKRIHVDWHGADFGKPHDKHRRVGVTIK